MAFTPILSDQPISYVMSRANYRNSARENLAGGTPVFFVPTSASLNDYGYGGPKYEYGYTYYNSPSNVLGNCTWWCWGRLNQTMGTSLPNYGDANNWYSRYTGSKDPNANNINPGDIIVLDDGDAGHVMFVEQVSGNTVYISQSAYSTRTVWSGMSCLVANYQKSEIVAGNTLDMYKGHGGAYFQTVIGVIHTGEDSPTPPTPTEEPSVTVYPSAYDSIMQATEDYIDFNFTVVVEGIPIDEDASGAISFSSNCYRRMYTSNWTYTEYVIDGVRYLTGRRSLIVRYDRLHDYAYYDTAYMYYRKTFSNGSVNSATRMGIQIDAKETEDEIISIIAYLLGRRKKRVKYKIK